jgi:hypothetical protein
VFYFLSNPPVEDSSLVKFMSKNSISGCLVGEIKIIHPVIWMSFAELSVGCLLFKMTRSECIGSEDEAKMARAAR